MSFTSLLKQAAESTHGNDHATQRYLPDGLYVAKIKDANLYPRYWGTQPKRDGTPSKRTVADCKHCYAARFQLVDIFETDDPDVNAHLREELDKFGDWRGFDVPSGLFSQTLLMADDNGQVKEQKVLAVMGVGDRATFPLIDTDETFGKFLGFNQDFYRWLEVRQDGSVGGFVSLLSQRPDVMSPLKLPENPASPESLMATVAATVDAYAIIEIATETSNVPDGSERRSTRIVRVSSVS